jgi:xylulose-5-phosphate/fructose-6-phosphate phosphoketolase
VVRNRLDRFHLAGDVVDRLPHLKNALYVKQALRDDLVEHDAYIRAHGIDMPMVRDWQWPG